MTPHKNMTDGGGLHNLHVVLEDPCDGISQGLKTSQHKLSLLIKNMYVHIFFVVVVHEDEKKRFSSETSSLNT